MRKNDSPEATRQASPKDRGTAHADHGYAPHVERMSGRELELDAAQRAGTVTPPARLHTDAAANAAADAHGARAFTIGSDIMFGAGQYAPGTPAGDRLLAHELVHVQQFREGRVPPGHVPRWPLPQFATVEPQSEDPDRESDAPPAPAKDPRVEDVPDVEPEPIEILFSDDVGALMFQAVNTIVVPAEASYTEIAKRLYDDPKHQGGFTRDGRRVHITTLDGLVPEIASRLRRLIDKDNQNDVDWLVAKVSERRIDGEDERAMISRIAWWADRGELRDEAGKSYFDILIDRLDHRQLHESGLFGGTTRSATEWIIIEVEEQQDQLIMLLAKRGVRAPNYPRTGDRIPEYAATKGPLSPDNWSRIVGTYTYTKPAGRMALYSTDYLTGNINVTKRLPIEETTADRAETALRNSAETGPRVMIPGGDGKFYGYAVDFKFFRADYSPGEEKLTNWWWMYPGTVFVKGGEYHPEYGEGTEAQKSQRKDVLTTALASPDELLLRGLDFDALAIATLEQRLTIIQRALKAKSADDASLIARVLYACPIAEFPRLERQLSTGGLMTALMHANFPEGYLSVIGRVFTVRSMQTMRVPGEGQTDIPTLEVGDDEDGFYHYAYASKAEQAPSKALAAGEFKASDQVALGHEQALPGEASSTINRSVITIQPAIYRSSNILANVVRGLRGTLADTNGAPMGPYLPTQLVRVKTLGTPPTERIVTVVEAMGLMELPSAAMYRVLKAHITGGMWLMAGMQVTRVFGVAFAEGLAAGGGGRAILGELGAAAVSEAGVAALTNLAVVGALDVVERYRKDLEATEAGREFLGVFDTVVMLWVAHDVARLVATGIIPRAIKTFDWAITTVKGINEGLMPMRAELEALSRTIKRYATPAEAAEAAAVGGGTMAAPAEAKPGFYTLLRISRGEVAAERLTTKVAGSAAEASTKSVLDRLGSAVERAETAASRATTEADKAAASAAVESTSRARLDIAQRAAQLKPDARAQFLNAVDGVLKARPGSLDAIADLLSAAAVSRQPNLFIGEVGKLIGRPISDDALRTLGRKALEGPTKLDLAWLNRTSISDEALDFLGRDKRTPWDLYRRASVDPTDGGVMRAFRTSARGAGAEMIAEGEAAKLGTNVQRQVQMGGSEIDFELIIKGIKRGFEVKGWTTDTWKKALDAASVRMRSGQAALTSEQSEAVKKFDHMLKQLRDIQTTTGEAPLLGVTDALSSQQKRQLMLLLKHEKVLGVKLVPLDEAAIKEAAAGKIGAAVGVPRP